MNNPPPPPQPYEPEQPYVAPASGHVEPGSNKWSGCLIGCLVAFGVCCVLCAGGGIYTYFSFSGWVTTAARATVEALLQESDLPREEQTAILDEFDRVANAYKEGEITLEQLGEIMQDLAESPVTGLVMLQAIETKYLEPSGLSDEEKEEARRTIVRVVRGTIEEKFSEEELEGIMGHFLIESDGGDPQQQKQLKPSLTDDELRTLLSDARELADAKEVPDEDYDVKISEVVRQVVDAALAK